MLVRLGKGGWGDGTRWAFDSQCIRLATSTVHLRSQEAGKHSAQRSTSDDRAALQPAQQGALLSASPSGKQHFEVHSAAPGPGLWASHSVISLWVAVLASRRVPEIEFAHLAFAGNLPIPSLSYKDHHKATISLALVDGQGGFPFVSASLYWV